MLFRLLRTVLQKKTNMYTKSQDRWTMLLLFFTYQTHEVSMFFLGTEKSLKTV